MHLFQPLTMYRFLNLLKKLSKTQDGEGAVREEINALNKNNTWECLNFHFARNQLGANGYLLSNTRLMGVLKD